MIWYVLCLFRGRVGRCCDLTGAASTRAILVSTLGRKGEHFIASFSVLHELSELCC